MYNQAGGLLFVLALSWGMWIKGIKREGQTSDALPLFWISLKAALHAIVRHP